MSLEKLKEFERKHWESRLSYEEAGEIIQAAIDMRRELDRIDKK